jgi:hypothetical protein
MSATFLEARACSAIGFQPTNRQSRSDHRPAPKQIREQAADATAN